MRLLTLMLATLATAFTPNQVAIIRAVMKREPAPHPIAVIDSIHHKGIAFTAVNNRQIFVDGNRLLCCERTLHNVMFHEWGHAAAGLDHGDAKEWRMNYTVTVSPSGRVIEDNFLL